MTRIARCPFHHQSLAARFQDTFKIDVRKYLSPTFGFDACRFGEEFIRPKARESTYQAIERRFGAEAVVVVKALISTPFYLTRNILLGPDEQIPDPRPRKELPPGNV